MVDIAAVEVVGAIVDREGIREDGSAVEL